MRYLGSTIVLEDEACFCQFEASSVAVVTEVNRRADLPFDRIVPAVLVQPTQRSGDMSISTSIPKTARRRRSRPLAAITALAAVIAVAAWAISDLRCRLRHAASALRRADTSVGAAVADPSGARVCARDHVNDAREAQRRVRHQPNVGRRAGTSPAPRGRCGRARDPRLRAAGR